MKRYLPLISLIILVLALIATRVILTGEFRFFFLIWNLFLASLPLMLGRVILHFDRRHEGVALLLPLTVLWLLFLPNGPYIVTDFIHLRHGSGSILFDALLLSAAATAGLIATFQSLADIGGMIARRTSSGIAHLFSLTVLLLCSYGIYLGRVVRLNSWDALLFPRPVARVVRNDILYPSENIFAWKFTLAMVLLLWLIYGIVSFRPDRGVWSFMTGRGEIDR